MFRKCCFGMLFLLMFNLAYAVSNHASMGKIDFPITIKKKVQPIFTTGVLFLHNFDYEKAREQFQMAEKRDPSSVLPYWGEAMTYNHPLWDEVDLNAGRQVLKKLGNTVGEQLAKARDEKEKS